MSYTSAASIVSLPFLFVCRLAISLAALFCVFVVLFCFHCQCSGCWQCRCRCSIMPILFCLLRCPLSIRSSSGAISACDLLPGVSFGLNLVIYQTHCRLAFCGSYCYRLLAVIWTVFQALIVFNLERDHETCNFSRRS